MKLNFTSSVYFIAITTFSFLTLEAVSALENVAVHINEMQNITEKFLPIFQELASATPGLNVSITTGSSLKTALANGLHCWSFRIMVL